MMKKCIVLYILFLLNELSAQSIAWIDTIQYPGNTTSAGLSQSGSKMYTSGSFYPTHAGINGVYIHEYDLNGNLLWRDTLSSNNATTSGGVVADASGNCYTAVWVGGSYLKIGGTNFPGGSIMYIIKYNSSGQIQWVVNQGNYSDAIDMAIDKTGNVCVTGGCSGGGYLSKYSPTGNLLFYLPLSAGGYNVSLDAQNFIYVSFGNSISKYYPSGGLAWTYTAPVANFKAATDSVGNNYITLPGYYATSSLVKLSPNGLVLWNLNLNYAGGRSICTDKNNDIIVAGLWGSGNAAYGVEIHKYSPTGVDLWSHQLPNSSYLRPTDITADGNFLYLSSDQAYFDNAILIKINTPLTTSIPNSQQSNTFSIYPNPSSGIFTLKGETTQIKISVHDVLGNCVLNKDYRNETEMKIDLSEQPKGIYFVEIICGNEKAVRKIVIE